MRWSGGRLLDGLFLRQLSLNLFWKLMDVISHTWQAKAFGVEQAAVLKITSDMRYDLKCYILLNY